MGCDKNGGKDSNMRGGVGSVFSSGIRRKKGFNDVDESEKVGDEIGATLSKASTVVQKKAMGLLKRIIN
tara:strand:+ start:483 stop:689 length:207 start_codon:yes stop_codon:yes gene_type:complete